MEANLWRTGGMVFAEDVMMALTETGMARPEAYELLEGLARQIRKGPYTTDDGKTYRSLGYSNPTIVNLLGMVRLDKLFDPWNSLKNVQSVYGSFVIQSQRGGITFSEEPQDIPLMMAQMREHGMDASAMLGHRVVTLSREVAAALLARYLEADLEELVNRGIPWIDLICCDFYPARDAIAKIDATIDSVNEMTDIGGPTMVLAAAQGSRIVICDPADHELVISLLQAEGDVNKETRQQLRAKAFATTGVYDLDLARFYGQGEYDGVFGKRVLTLGKGETDAQSPAALYSSRQITYPLAWKNFCIIS